VLKIPLFTCAGIAKQKQVSEEANSVLLELSHAKHPFRRPKKSQTEAAPPVAPIPAVAEKGPAPVLEESASSVVSSKYADIFTESSDSHSIPSPMMLLQSPETTTTQGPLAKQLSVSLIALIGLITAGVACGICIGCLCAAYCPVLGGSGSNRSRDKAYDYLQ
jgi:hypothetical protein